jgi:5-methylcytosine-specific restriction protein A
MLKNCATLQIRGAGCVRRRFTLPIAPPVFRPRGPSRAESEREYDRRRGSAAQRLYDGAWQRASKSFLRAHPLCAYCALDGRTVAAGLVDHLYPHRGDRALFWERRNWVSSCKPCHDGFKQSVERRGLTALHDLAVRLGLPRMG